MGVNNPPKFWLLVIVLVGTFVLLGTGSLTSEQGLPIISAIVGYGIGNGIAARAGEPSSPVFGRRSTPKD